MEILRTPDECFADLPGYPYEPKYVDLSGVRMHYVDEGPRDGPVVLLLHGEPSWSYLYRHMIPILAEAGCRVLAPDFIGFGRSDKPSRREDYTYERHVSWTEGFLGAVGARDVTLVCQDWGGLIGLRLVAAHSGLFARVVAANTFLSIGRESMPEAFSAWLRYSQEAPELPVGQIVQRGTLTRLSDKVVAAYDAPFPDEAFKAGARQFPALVPISEEDPQAVVNVRAWEELRRFDRPFLTAFSDGDPITAGLDEPLRSAIPGAAGRAHTTIRDAGHFLQEDRGPELAAVVLKFMA